MTVEELKEENREFVEDFITLFGNDLIFGDYKDGTLRLVTKDGKAYTISNKGMGKDDLSQRINFTAYANSGEHMSEEELRDLLEKFITDPLAEKMEDAMRAMSE